MTGYTPPFFLEQFVDHAGNPLSGGSLTFLVAGSTSLPKNIYLDYALTNIAPNPFPLSADGFAPQYFMEAGLYKVVIKDSTGSIIATRDYIDASAGGGGAGADTYKVKSTNADPTADYLANKLIGGSSIHVGTVTLPGSTIKTTITDDGRIPVNASDYTIEYLEDKLVDSASIKWNTTGNVTKKLSAEVVSGYDTVLPVWCILKDTDPETPPFGLAQIDLENIWTHHYGVAATLMQTTLQNGDLSIWYLEGGTYYGDATWVEKPYIDGQLILNSNKGAYDYLHTHPLDITTDDTLSNYPAGLYSLTRYGDNHYWMPELINQYPDPAYNVSSVLTYQSNNHSFEWIPNDSLTTDGTVRIDGFDSPNYLGYKIQAGSGISVVDTPNGVYGRFLKINATGSNPNGYGYSCTMHVANATTVLAPNLIGLRNELTVLFVPFTDMDVTYNLSMFGCFLSQGGTGNLTFTLRDEQYRLIAASASISDPSPSVFLELVCAFVQDPITQASLNSYTLKMGNRYNLGISWTANGIQLLGDETNQNTNFTPYPAYKVDNVTGGLIYQLTGGGESKMRPFIRLVTKV